MGRPDGSRPERDGCHAAAPEPAGNSVTEHVEAIPAAVPAAVPVPVAHGEPEKPRFIVEELRPYSQPESTAANRPLALDDPDAVWWVSSGGVDVFFTQFEPGSRRGTGGICAGWRKGARSSRSAGFAGGPGADSWPWVRGRPSF